VSTIRNIHGEPVPITGGITSRELFRDLLSRRVERGGVPNVLWLLTSLALIAAGVWVLI
jgi:hypothetical protein